MLLALNKFSIYCPKSLMVVSHLPGMFVSNTNPSQLPQPDTCMTFNFRIFKHSHFCLNRHTKYNVTNCELHQQWQMQSINDNPQLVDYVPSSYPNYFLTHIYRALSSVICWSWQLKLPPGSPDKDIEMGFDLCRSLAHTCRAPFSAE